MQVRVDQLVPYGHNDAAIATFHAFGDRLIREFAFELGLPPDVRVLSRPETVVFLREHLFEFELDEYRPLGDPTRFLDALATLFSRAKDEDVSPAAYLAHAERLAEEAAAAAAAVDDARGRRDATRIGTPRTRWLEDARRQLELARAFGRYQDLLAANGCIDFGDQVSLALRLVRESPAVREAVQRRFRYILVDEFQDTNRAQAELVGAARGAAPQRDGRGRRRSVHLQVPRRRDQQHPGVPGALPERAGRRAAPELPVAARPSSTSSYRLVRHNDPDRLEVRAGVVKRLVAERQVPDAPRRSATRRSRPARRRRTGSRRDIGAPDRRGRAARATTPCSSARTPPRTPSSGR